MNDKSSGFGSPKIKLKNITIVRRSLSRSFHTFKKFALLILLVHLPAAFCDVLQFTVKEEFLQEQLFLAVIIAVVTIFIETFCFSFSVLLINSEKNPSRPTFAKLWPLWAQRLTPFCYSSLVTGLVLITAMAAFVFPFFIVGALFLFVPALIITGKEKSIWPAFNRSQSLCFKRPGLCFLIMVMMGYCLLHGLQEGEVWLLTEITKRGLNSASIQLLFLVAVFFLSLIVNGFYSLFLGHLFFIFRDEL